MADQVVAIFAGTQGYFDKVALSDVASVEKELISFMKEKRTELRNKLVQTGTLDDATMAELRKALEDFLKELEKTGQKAVAAS
jgi:F-type H+-transporting ATPase subunit alpha